MAATDASATLVPPARRTGLRREIGFIGLLWASGGSIIGSGWLFGAQGALATAGPAAIISWVIGGVAIMLLALVHAELGAMYPVAGGTARFAHRVRRVAITLGVIVYVLLQVVFLAALPAAQIHGTWANAGYTKFSGPFAQLATLVGLGWLAAILYIDAVISPGGTGLIYTTASSRVSYGLSRNGYVPSVYERTNPQGIPWVGLITAFVAGCICFMPFPAGARSSA